MPREKSEAYLVVPGTWLSLEPKKILWDSLEHNEMKKEKNVQFIYSFYPIRICSRN